MDSSLFQSILHSFGLSAFSSKYRLLVLRFLRISFDMSMEEVCSLVYQLREQLRYEERNKIPASVEDFLMSNGMMMIDSRHFDSRILFALLFWLRLSSLCIALSLFSCTFFSLQSFRFLFLSFHVSMSLAVLFWRG